MSTERITNVNQMKLALLRGKADSTEKIAELAETVVDAVDEIDTKTADMVTKPGGGSILSVEATITTTWTEDMETGVKSQLVPVEGMTAEHDVTALDVVMTHERTTEGYALFVEENNQFLNCITNGDAETVDGGIMFYIYGEANTVNIPIAGTAVS